MLQRLLQTCLGCLAAVGALLGLAAVAWLCSLQAEPWTFSLSDPAPTGLRIGHLRRPSERLLGVLRRLSSVNFQQVPLTQASQGWLELAAERLDLVWAPLDDFALGWARYGAGTVVFCPVQGQELMAETSDLVGWPQDQGGLGPLRWPTARVARDRSQVQGWLRAGQVRGAVLCPPAAGTPEPVLEVWVASRRALSERRSELVQLISDFGRLSGHWSEQRAVVERAAGGRGSLAGLEPVMAQPTAQELTLSLTRSHAQWADSGALNLKTRPPAPVELLAPASSPAPLPQATPEPEASPASPSPPPLASPLAQATPATVAVAADLPLKLPGPASASGALNGELGSLMRQAQSTDTAYDWRRLADAAVSQRRFALASQAYAREAELYRKLGDLNAAQVEAQKAARFGTQLALYAQVPQPVTGPGRERLEPQRGCYLGAFIDRDDSLEQHMLASQIHGDIPQFNAKVGKPHGSFFMYRGYGTHFPSEWVEYVKSQGAIPQIAWEPASLDLVKDDQYLRDFVEAARQADWPIFIRFAGEMNGAWTAYHGNPARYRQAFRTVYEAFRRAPRAALIWCPNCIPQTGLDAYYPGDDACDWVGVNLYSVLYLDNDRSRPGEAVHPADLLDYVYRKYSARKPIAIGEYAATHLSSVDPRPRPDFAVTKLNQLYGSLPTRYPRVKLVSWFDCNNLLHARPGRQLNNYLLTDDPTILQSYREAVAAPWFLSGPGQSSPVELRELGKKARLQAGQSVEAWFRTYIDRPQVFFRLDGKVVHATRTPGRNRWRLPEGLRGTHRLEVLLYDERGQFIDSSATTVVLAQAGRVSPSPK